MATANVTQDHESSNHSNSNMMKVALPYIVAIGAQLPMLLLFFRSLWAKTHYQTFAFAIVATAAIIWMRWPREERMQFHRSLASDILLVLGLICALGSVAFVEPWFTAASVMLLLTSFLARTADSDTKKSLWTAALPLFVFLPLPFGRDVGLITMLQRSSAWFTSRLLDLLGLGHHMDGTVIEVPGRPPYGVAEACSGVQSFFTLLFICMVFIVINRRISSSVVSGVILSILAMIVYFVGLTAPGFGLGYVAVAILLWGFLGFRASILIVSAVFWALFINTVRILIIPIMDINFDINLVHGLPHDLLGWAVLFLGFLLLLSTDQLLMFLFGPVDPEAGEAGPFGKLITRFWNQLISGQEANAEDSGKKKRKGRRPITDAAIKFSWLVAIVVAIGGVLQLYDVQQSYSNNLKVRFFDADVTRPFSEDDLPKTIEDWTIPDKNGYTSQTRDRGSDLGRHSDIWQYRAPRCNVIASLDQTFPGWHELTTCYQNQGWKLIDRVKIVPTKPGQEGWTYIEARFEKETGQRGYLLFSLFDGSGGPIDAPLVAGGLSSFIQRATNRLSNRIRRSLFTSEAYQTQVWLTHFSDLDEPLKREIADRYMTIREIMRTEFMKKEGITADSSTAGPGSADASAELQDSVSTLGRSGDLADNL